MTAAQRRKRPLSKREPQPDEFSDDNEYSRAWTKWREDRDHNNKSVKRSRERAKIRKVISSPRYAPSATRVSRVEE